MILKVARLGHPVIRTAAKPVELDRIVTSEFQGLLDDMVETMREYSGVGLAAPQVYLPLQIAVLEVAQNPRYPEAPSVALTYLINPVVEFLGEEKVEGWEGCLSIPEMRGIVPRWRRLRVRAVGRQGEPLDIVAEDFHARVIQHETDHLKGEVYIDRMADMRSLAHLPEWQRFIINKEPWRETRGAG